MAIQNQVNALAAQVGASIYAVKMQRAKTERKKIQEARRKQNQQVKARSKSVAEKKQKLKVKIAKGGRK